MGGVRNNHSLDIGAREEVVERLVGVIGVKINASGNTLECLSGRKLAGVDGLQVEVLAGKDSGEMLSPDEDAGACCTLEDERAQCDEGRHTQDGDAESSHGERIYPGEFEL